ncbi:MAG: PAS domain S-box protein, partial [Pseudomonadota bacterium]
EADQRTLWLQAWSTRTLEEMCTAEGKGRHYDIDEAGVWVDCLHERRPVIHNDLSALPHRKGMPAGHADVIRELVVPVFRGDRLTAVLGVGNKPVDYTASDIEAVSLLADLAWDIAERKRAEEEIRASVSRLKEAQRVAQIGSWELDLTTNRLLGSDEIYRMFEIEPREFAGSCEALLALIHPEDRETVNKAYADSLANRTPYEIIHRLKFPDGRIKYVHERWEHSYDAAGIALRSVGTVQDITELTQVQLRLENKRARLRTLVQTIPDLVWLKNPDGVYLSCNSRFERFFGAKEADIVGKTDYDFVDADLADFFREHDRKAIAAGRPSTNEEWITFADDGHRELLETIKTPMYDSDGSLIGVLGIARNITATRKTEEAHRRLATAIEQAAEAVIIADTEGIIQYVNPAAERTSGFSSEELLGKTPRVFKSGEHDATFYERLWAAVKEGEIWSGRFVNRRKDGRLYHEEATISPVKDGSGKITNFVAVKRDITEHLQLSKQLVQAQKMESIGTLAAGIAHDFNNLLQVILGYSDMLLFRKKPTDPDYGGLHAIRQAGWDGADLAKRILAFSRRQEPNARPVNLNHEMERVEKMLRRAVPKMIQMELIPADDLMTVNADPGQMEQVLLNLVVNAQHAMPEGGRLTIETANVTLGMDYSRTHLDVEPGKYVVLTVSDTGHGMDKKVLEHIFEPFFTTKGLGEGTGLGLAMVYGIVKSHKGHITCYSEPGTGTSFKIYLPAVVQEIEQDVAATRRMPARGTETILLVDDENLIRKMAEEMLGMAGYTVLTAGSGTKALEIYRSDKDRIALVILDLIMPEMGGRQCLDELLKVNQNVKVVIASGYSIYGTSKDAVEAGAKGFISKPYDVKELLSVVRTALDESKQ